ncbi:PREDICTED: sepiapterin reductase-like [Priapulus caudatus]|uniref:Sepiapterin reductase n=1 Tax=Priapulus caudatus TaxID=37621 RepID=A0ABM1EH77_PRICU|nr:PREDICTED: sepiapterin reductase-like [Priapulus caudatus]XP_014671549.1 PREDICTED: sepiapterin reductase-like [Priapulus caudatus]XP_014671550.1 PREDICTED: sepiapterin reductase-like [Priapulus caudatus]
MPADIWSLRTFCIVTGGGKGLGYSIVVNLASRFASGSVIAIAGRTEANLLRTQEYVESHYPEISVQPLVVDLCLRDTYDDIFPTIFSLQSINAEDFQQVMLIHNAGTLGDITHTAIQQDDTRAVRRNLDLNIGSTMLLTAAFFKFFPDRTRFKTYVVNISSLCAIQPVKSFSMYCTGKAARDMFFRVMAEEEPDVRVLSYAPGPLLTSMTTHIIDHVGDKDTKQMFKDMKDNEQLLDCDTSMMKFVCLLEDDKFESGAHVDYYDVEKICDQ